MTRRLDRTALIGLGIAGVSAIVYWLSNKNYDAGRGDFFYLADAFLHGRTWLDLALGPNDVIPDGAKFYVPFAPFPAIVLMPLVAIVGPLTADQWESGINALLAASVVGLGWWLLGRLGVQKIADRARLVILLGFSTQIWWVTTRGGVWHTGHLIATILTLLCLIELFGRRRAALIGLMAGAAFLTRAPVAFALPFYALLLADDRVWKPRQWPWKSWGALAAGFAPAVLFFLWYNAVRFGSPLESGYALATLPPWLEAQRQVGLFSIAHIPMNLDYLFVHPPSLSTTPPFVRPDGLGMSIFITSPGLLYAIRAPWRERRTLFLAGAALAVLVPTLLYYGGGWLQYGYRYALDSIPFIWALCGLAAVRDEANGGEMSWIWRILIGIGLIVGALGVYWAYNL
jgi:hypothetical protein